MSVLDPALSSHEYFSHGSSLHAAHSRLVWMRDFVAAYEELDNSELQPGRSSGKSKRSSGDYQQSIDIRRVYRLQARSSRAYTARQASTFATLHRQISSKTLRELPETAYSIRYMRCDAQKEYEAHFLAAPVASLPEVILTPRVRPDPSDTVAPTGSPLSVGGSGRVSWEPVRLRPREQVPAADELVRRLLGTGPGGSGTSGAGEGKGKGPGTLGRRARAAATGRGPRDVTRRRGAGGGASGGYVRHRKGRGSSRGWPEEDEDGDEEEDEVDECDGDWLVFGRQGSSRGKAGGGGLRSRGPRYQPTRTAESASDQQRGSSGRGGRGKGRTGRRKVKGGASAVDEALMALLRADLEDG